MSGIVQAARRFDCPRCGAIPGQRCPGSPHQSHAGRRTLAARRLSDAWRLTPAQRITLSKIPTRDAVFGIPFDPNASPVDDWPDGLLVHRIGPAGLEAAQECVAAWCESDHVDVVRCLVTLQNALQTGGWRYANKTRWESVPEFLAGALHSDATTVGLVIGDADGYAADALWDVLCGVTRPAERIRLGPVGANMP